MSFEAILQDIVLALRRRHRRRADGQRRHRHRGVRRAAARPTGRWPRTSASRASSSGASSRRRARRRTRSAAAPVVETLVVLARFSLLFRGVDDETFLVVVVTPDGNLGKARYLMRRHLLAIRQEL